MLGKTSTPRSILDRDAESSSVHLLSLGATLRRRPQRDNGRVQHLTYPLVKEQANQWADRLSPPGLVLAPRLPRPMGDESLNQRKPSPKGGWENVAIVDGLSK